MGKYSQETKNLLLAWSWCESAEKILMEVDTDMFGDTKFAICVMNALHALMRCVSPDTYGGLQFRELPNDSLCPAGIYLYTEKIFDMDFEIQNNIDYEIDLAFCLEVFHWARMWTIDLVLRNYDAAEWYSARYCPRVLRDKSGDEFLNELSAVMERRAERKSNADN